MRYSDARAAEQSVIRHWVKPLEIFLAWKEAEMERM